MTTTKTNNDAVAEVHNGSKFYPWCLKTTEKKMKKEETHIYYKKKTGGNLIISVNAAKHVLNMSHCYIPFLINMLFLSSNQPYVVKAQIFLLLQ